jgi:multisubunit Na+/H+ antiporter MnhG subunit
VSVGDAATYALLGTGVALEVIASLGVLAMRNVFDRLHYLGPASLGAILIAAAVWVAEGPSFISLKATLLARISELGAWQPRDGEEAEARRR